jgi:hypothetical protein
MGIRGVRFRGVTNESVEIPQQTHMFCMQLCQRKLVEEVLERVINNTLTPLTGDGRDVGPCQQHVALKAPHTPLNKQPNSLKRGVSPSSLPHAYVRHKRISHYDSHPLPRSPRDASSGSREGGVVRVLLHERL